MTLEVENRKRQQAALEAAIAQKQAELERYGPYVVVDLTNRPVDKTHHCRQQLYGESLRRMEQDQQLMLEKFGKGS